MNRALAYLFTLTALGLLAWGGYSAFAPDRPDAEPPFRVEGQDRDCGELPLGTHTLAFRVTNPADRERRIIGLSAGCRPTCCYKSTTLDEVVGVPPGGTAVYECELAIHAPGPFEAPMTLFVEENGVREIILTVRGIGIEPGKSDDRTAARR